MGISEACPSALLSPAFPGSVISALCLPPAAASQPSPRGALILTCSASGFQFLFLWCVYGPANLDGQQVRGTPLREGRDKGTLLTATFPNLLGLPFLQAASSPGSILRIPYPCTGADKPEAISDYQDPWKR